jgi:chemotaxis signal transduction protein
MDVRGVGMLLIDLRAKFGLARVDATNRTRVIVADT